MINQPWLQDSAWERHDPKLQELAANPVRLPHLDQTLKGIPIAPGVFSILGARQVGKSTLLRLLASRILEELPGNQVAFVEGDAIESWRELLSLLTDFLQSRPSSQLRAALLIDEITSIAQWHRAIKLSADRGQLRDVLLVYTGSSMTSLKEGGELFPGRRGRHSQTGFQIHPVSYRDVAEKISLEEFLRIGGFPWAINEYLRLKALPDYVGEIYWGWLKGEFLKRGKSEILLRHVSIALSRRVGTGLSHNKLAQEIGIASNETARQYLELLQDCFAILEIPWMDLHRKTIAPKKNRKYYPIDPLLYHLFKSGGTLPALNPTLSLASEEEGRLAELIVCQELKRRHPDLGYWAGKREIDFVSGSFGGIEVKYQNRVIPQEFSWYERAFPGRPFLILTKNDAFYQGRIKATPLKEWLLSG